MWWVILFLAQVNADGLFRVFTNDWKVSLLDPVTGSLSCVTPLDLPEPERGCAWNFGNGGHGQSSTVFYMNQTVYFLAQQLCGRDIGETALFSYMGPWCRKENNLHGDSNLRLIAQIDTTEYIGNLNINWDFTCNVVVIVPKKQGAYLRYETKQVSTYDGQIRPQADYKVEKKDCEDCWVKTGSFSALSRGNNNLNFPHNSVGEWNCGDSCVLYTVETYKSSALSPSAFVGRSFRTGALLVNQTAPFRILSMSLDPFPRHVDQFLGVGTCVCATETWCLPECKKLYIESGIMYNVLFHYLPSTGKFTYLAPIKAYDHDLALGVEFSFPIVDHPRAHVLDDRRVWNYDLTVLNGVITSATQSSVSPVIPFGNNIYPVLWAPLSTSSQ